MFEFKKLFHSSTDSRPTPSQHRLSSSLTVHTPPLLLIYDAIVVGHTILRTIRRYEYIHTDTPDPTYLPSSSEAAAHHLVEDARILFSTILSVNPIQSSSSSAAAAVAAALCVSSALSSTIYMFIHSATVKVWQDHFPFDSLIK